MQSRCSGWLSVFDDQARALITTMIINRRRVSRSIFSCLGPKDNRAEIHGASQMEVNSVLKDIARFVGNVSVRKVTNELNWVTETGCGGSINSISSSMYSSAPIGAELVAAQFIH